MRGILMTKVGEKARQHQMKGLCATCMRRWRCPKSFKYLDLSECNAYRVHKNSLIYKKETEQNGKCKTDKGTV